MFGREINEWDLPEKMRKNMGRLDDLINWPSISGFKEMEQWIKGLAHEVFADEARESQIRMERDALQKKFDALCAHFGVEVVKGPKYIVQKVKKEKK